MNGDFSLQFFAALIFVLALIGALAYTLKRWGGSGLLMRRGAERRLGIIEVLPVDAHRRLVLLRRDDREHLVMLGRTHDLVIETGIRTPGAPGDQA